METVLGLTLSPKDRFNEVVYWNTESYSKDETTRLWRKSVTMEFCNQCCYLLLGHRDIYLEKIRAIQMNQGNGSKAMKWITDIADEEGVNIILHAAPDLPSNTARLYRFYERFGFTNISGNIFYRPFAYL